MKPVFMISKCSRQILVDVVTRLPVCELIRLIVALVCVNVVCIVELRVTVSASINCINAADGVAHLIATSWQ